MQVAAMGGFTMVLLTPALLRPRNIEADDDHALKKKKPAKHIRCTSYTKTRKSKSGMALENFGG
jgi:hypothetical protein